jgi:hypothetical protein
MMGKSLAEMVNCRLSIVNGEVVNGEVVNG